MQINTTTARNATLQDLAQLLTDQHARKLDVVVNAAALRSEGGILRIRGTEPVITPDGVTAADGHYRPTGVYDEGVSEKLGIPLAYLRRMRTDRPDLYDTNVNGWLHGGDDAPQDPRRFLVRAFRAGDDDGVGVARALLSDTYRVMDNLDVLTAALQGVKDAGVPVEVDGCDLTERRMYVRVRAPQVQALAPELLRGYRSPFSGAEGADNPTMFAGFVISNSEVGSGAFSITPRLVVQVCSNGMTVTKDAMRAVHLGARQDEGLVRWSEDTQQKQLALVTARARDAVATFLDVDYMLRVITDMTATAQVPVGDAVATVQHVGKKLAFDQATQAGVLDHFIKGGQPTAGGVLGAVTSWAQTVADADAAADLEGQGMRAMELAAAHATGRA